MASHLLVFQYDKAHNGDVNGVPNAWIVIESSHLPEKDGEENQVTTSIQEMEPGAHPSHPGACTSDHIHDHSGGHTSCTHYCGHV